MISNNHIFATIGNTTKICIIIVVLFSLGILSAPDIFASPCSPGSALARWQWMQYGKVKNIVIVHPFENQSKEGSEGWLANGLAELAGDLFTSAKDTGVIKGVIRLFPPEPLNPNFIVSGAYQQTSTDLRIFLKMTDASGNILYQSAISLSPRDSGRVFVEMEKSVAAMMDKTKISYDKKKLEEIYGDTFNYVAYSSYIKGLEAMWKFDPNYREVATMWFEEARKNDIHFQRPYFAEQDIYGLMALETKFLGGAAAPWLEKIGKIETQRLRFADRPSPVAPKKPKVEKIDLNPPVTNRYLIGNSYFMSGESAFNSGDSKKAITELEAALKYTPEDTVVLGKLNTLYTQEGNTKKQNDIQARFYKFGICQP